MQRKRERNEGKPIAAGGMEGAWERDVVEVRGVDAAEWKQARAREPKEGGERESACFGTRDDSVGEGEGLLFSGTEGEERVG